MFCISESHKRHLPWYWVAFLWFPGWQNTRLRSDAYKPVISSAIFYQHWTNGNTQVTLAGFAFIAGAEHCFLLVKMINITRGRVYRDILKSLLLPPVHGLSTLSTPVSPATLRLGKALSEGQL